MVWSGGGSARPRVWSERMEMSSSEVGTKRYPRGNPCFVKLPSAAAAAIAPAAGFIIK